MLIRKSLTISVVRHGGVELAWALHGVLGCMFQTVMHVGSQL